MGELRITDLVSKDILQEIQNFCVAKNNIATGISAADGEYLTDACYDLSDYCEKFIKQSPEGKRRCDACDCANARNAQACGKAMPYTCHAGLIDFSGPIIVDDVLYGFIVGGQVCKKRPTKEEVYALAKELDLDPEGLYEASLKLRELSDEEMDNVIANVQKMSDLISDVAKNKLLVIEASKEVEAAAKMKSDFLANMSHEIRTPMNAIIGMADMALRQDLTDEARSYVRQIKRSGNGLLSIINDILDFSKIESGKMDITMVDYEPVQLLSDVSNVIQTRIGNKPVEFLMDLPTNLPGCLMGDDNRIKQIITNLANNAVKFTNQGKVVLSVEVKETGNNSYDMTCHIKDTGIGIKEADLSKIFNSFQQVDSKRNRNVEGTGLGLAISKQLVELMNGALGVDSIYGVGSDFYFTIPQLVLHEEKLGLVEHPEEISVCTYLTNDYLENQLNRDLNKFGIKYVNSSENDTLEGLEKLISQGINYIFVESKDFTAKFKEFICRHTDVTIVILLNFMETISCDCSNVVLMHKPAHLFQLVKLFNHEDLFEESEGAEDEVAIDFEAPDAKVLIVDDNEVNLTVAAGLMQPMNMQIETADSGRRCIDLISEKKYDIIFMDHMMPQMDGVETTHIIRRMHPEYNNVPIIALTANALAEAKSMFLVEGMNDFMAKPINMKDLIKILKAWLPSEKIQSVAPVKAESEIGELPDIPELAVEDAVKLVGNVKLYMDVVNNYYKLAPKKKAVILEALENKDWPTYAIEVHALKSSSRQIGAMDLGSKAEKLEFAGKACDEKEINQNTPDLIATYDHIIECLAPFVVTEEVDESSLEEYDAARTLESLEKLVDALDELDFTSGDEIISELNKYKYPDSQSELLQNLRDAMELMDVDAIDEIIENWKGELS